MDNKTNVFLDLSLKFLISSDHFAYYHHYFNGMSHSASKITTEIIRLEIHGKKEKGKNSFGKFHQDCISFVNERNLLGETTSA